MKSASKVLYLINGILGIIGIAIAVIFAVVIKTADPAELQKALADFFKQNPDITLDMVVNTGFAMFLVIAGFAAIDVIISFLGIPALKRGGTGFHIFALVISVITGLQLLLFLASLFGILSTKNE